MGANINSGAIFILLPLNAIFLAMGLFNLEYVIIFLLQFLLVSYHVIFFQSEMDIFSYIYHVACILCSLFWGSFFCYFGTKATSSALSISNVVFGSNWYMYPQNLRKQIILIIAKSQQPPYFHGLLLVRCTLEDFEKVFSFIF